uniref:argininosuccinate synthase n=1 Tax=Physcomitrium patens TaxID=3218 RepID=A0A2K1JPG7_PHYPA|nr:hypothetical protein PHYPA_015813 [Physcomitrium patens]
MSPTSCTVSAQRKVSQGIGATTAPGEMREEKKEGIRGTLNKVVLAYSGGLDTSVIVPWLREIHLGQVVNNGPVNTLLLRCLKENYGCEVVSFTADVGQGIGETEGLEAKAKASGASQLFIVDLKEEFVKDYIFPCLRAGAVYERKYLLGTSMARPIIAKYHFEQVRFELTFFALDPKLAVVAPRREWDIKGREDAIEYANEPVEDMYMMTVDPKDAPDSPEYVTIQIEKGLPVGYNGNKLSPAILLEELNELGGKHGIGRIDMVENRLVGMKSRGLQTKDLLALKYAELVYAGRWFDPLRESMDAFMKKMTETTTGEVTLKLFKGSVNVACRSSPNSLYREDISSFQEGSGIYNQADAAGFIRLYGLPTRVRAMQNSGL